LDSCKMYRIKLPYGSDEISQACCDVVSKNGLNETYIRPIVYRDAANLGLCPGPNDPVSVAVIAIEWGPLHGNDAIQNGCDVCVSSWKRIGSGTNPVLAKAGGHYLTSQLISMEAKQNGYDEGVAVDESGNLTEGAGANVFLLRKGKLLTPDLGSSILEGITRETVFEIAKQFGIECTTADIPRECLYSADELFMAGTAAEITPIRSVDRIDIGNGRPGKVTQLFQKRYKEIVTGKNESTQKWLTPIYNSKPDLVAEKPVVAG
ncbi:MAG: branched-chain amino acid transaminase, partial [Planctomycetota bacterium]